MHVAWGYSVESSTPPGPLSVQQKGSSSFTVRPPMVITKQGLGESNLLMIVMCYPCTTPERTRRTFGSLKESRHLDPQPNSTAHTLNC